MALRGNLVRKTESRRHARHSVTGTVSTMWENDGHEVMTNAQVVDVSIWGVRLRVAAKIPLHSFVTCNDRALGICGRGSVRYCNLVKGKYEIGIEFTSGSGWRAP